jgi:multiple sugar transport system permease protein
LPPAGLAAEPVAMLDAGKGIAMAEGRPRRSARLGHARLYAGEYLWVLPAFGFVLFFTFYAAGFAVWISLHDYSLTFPVRPFIGLANYTSLLADGDFRHALGLSLLFCAVDVPLTILIGFALALLLNQPIRGRAVFRAVFLLPWVVAMVIAGYMLKWMFADGTGILNYFLVAIGFGKIPWLSTGTGAFSALIASHAWKVYPFGMVILLAGLQGIPKELYEAAAIDGANWWQRMRHVTLPALAPQFLVLFILRTLNTFNMVDLIFAMTGGGPGDATTLLPYYMYKRAFEYLDLGYASAIAVAILAINLVLAGVYLKVLGARR